MRSLNIMLLLAVVAMATAAPANGKIHYNIHDAPALFEKYIKDYNKVYKDEADKNVHYRAFVASLELINKANEDSTNATFDINKFADYTMEEKRNLFGLRKING